MIPTPKILQYVSLLVILGVALLFTLNHFKILTLFSLKNTTLINNSERLNPGNEKMTWSKNEALGIEIQHQQDWVLSEGFDNIRKQVDILELRSPKVAGEISASLIFAVQDNLAEKSVESWVGEMVAKQKIESGIRGRKEVVRGDRLGVWLKISQGDIERVFYFLPLNTKEVLSIQYAQDAKYNEVYERVISSLKFYKFRKAQTEVFTENNDRVKVLLAEYRKVHHDHDEEAFLKLFYLVGVDEKTKGTLVRNFRKDVEYKVSSVSFRTILPDALPSYLKDSDTHRASTPIIGEMTIVLDTNSSDTIKNNTTTYYVGIEENKYVLVTLVPKN